MRIPHDWEEIAREARKFCGCTGCVGEHATATSQGGIHSWNRPTSCIAGDFVTAMQRAEEEK